GQSLNRLRRFCTRYAQVVDHSADSVTRWSHSRRMIGVLPRPLVCGGSNASEIRGHFQCGICLIQQNGSRSSKPSHKEPELENNIVTWAERLDGAAAYQVIWRKNQNSEVEPR